MATGIISSFLADVPLPNMVKVKQHFLGTAIPREQIRAEVIAQLQQTLSAQIRPGMSVAITAGSRGIANIALITKAIVDFVKDCGAYPFVFPAMGSHGGATAEGQVTILEHYQLTESYLGCPIRASMEVCSVGKSDSGTEVYLDKLACQADATILCNRVKVHTDFRGTYESGLVKMAVIGMGKQVGAEQAHATGFAHFPQLLPELGAYIFAHSNIIGGLAILENAKEQTAKLSALCYDEILEKEPALLAQSKQWMPQLPWDNLDALLIGQAGKDISGNGIDPNVTGRFTIPSLSQSKAKRIGILALSEETHGNFNGIGLADLITQALYEQCDFEVTYPNAFTSTVISDVKIPFLVANDKEAFQLALKTCNGLDWEKPRVVYIQDTLHLEVIWISEALWEEVKTQADIQTLSAPLPLCFDANGTLQIQV